MNYESMKFFTSEFKANHILQPKNISIIKE